MNITVSKTQLITLISGLYVYNMTYDALLGNVTRVGIGSASGYIVATLSNAYTTGDFTTDYPSAIVVGAITG